MTTFFDEQGSYSWVGKRVRYRDEKLGTVVRDQNSTTTRKLTVQMDNSAETMEIIMNNVGADDAEVHHWEFFSNHPDHKGGKWYRM